MKIGLITTTINVPEVLPLYIALPRNFELHVFVAGDEITDDQTPSYCQQLSNCYYLSVDEQLSLWSSAKLLPLRSITRRNIALLQALKWGADLIVSIDDDNFPIGREYWLHWQSIFSYPIHGLQVKGPWFDSGSLQFPVCGFPVVQRGFPQNVESACSFKPAGNFEIGLAQGAILGDPDTSAIDRISQRPEVHTVSELLRGGVICHDTWTPVNTQNTAYLRRFAPAMLCCPQFGRCDDIYASLLCETLLYAHGMGVHHGQPFVWQQRNPHNLLKDLAAEQWGMQNIIQLADWLKAFYVRPGADLIIVLRELYRDLENKFNLPGLNDLAQAWLNDCEKALAG